MSRVSVGPAVVTVVLLAISASAGPATAADFFWQVDRGNWATVGNWSHPLAIPGPADVAYVNNFVDGRPGSASVSSAVPTVAFIQVNNGGTISVGNQGVLATTGFINVGASFTGGTLRVSGGQFSAGDDIKIGVMSGFGSVVQTGGTVTTPKSVRVGDSTDTTSMFVGAGTYDLSGGALNAGTLLLAVRTGGSSLTPLNATFNLSGTGDATFDRLYSKLSTPAANVVINQTGGEMSVGYADFRGGTYNLGAGKLFAGHLGLYEPTAIHYNGGSIRTGTLELYHGAITMGGGGTEKLLETVTLFIQPTSGAAIDVNDNALVVSAADSGVVQWLRLGHNDGQWNGPGIRSSAAAAIGSPHPTALGIGAVGSSNVTTIAGQPLNPSALLVRYTLCGDADLDRTVGIGDFARLASHFNMIFMNWPDGDFNYDGRVSLPDFALLAANFNRSMASAPSTAWGRPGAAVPEPGVAALALGFSIAARRHRRAMRAGNFCVHFHPSRC